MWPARWCTATIGLRERRRGGFRERHADEQRPDESGPLRDRHRIQVRPAGARVGQRRVDDAADVAHVLPRREFGHDAAPLPMDLHLRGDDVRRARATAARGRRSPRRRRRPSRRRTSRCRECHGVRTRSAPCAKSAAQALGYGARAIAALGDDAGDRGRCGVTSNAGFQTDAPSGVSRAAPEVRHLARVALLDRNPVAVGRGADRWSRAAPRRRTGCRARAPARRRV